MSENEENGSRQYVKRHAASISISTMTTLIALVPAFWFVAKPHLVNAVTEAVTQDIKAQVKTSTQPLNAAFRIILKRQIDRLRLEISALENKREFDAANWTVADAELLENKRIELEDLQIAYKAILGN